MTFPRRVAGRRRTGPVARSRWLTWWRLAVAVALAIAAALVLTDQLRAPPLATTAVDVPAATTVGMAAPTPPDAQAAAPARPEPSVVGPSLATAEGREALSSSTRTAPTPSATPGQAAASLTSTATPTPRRALPTATPSPVPRLATPARPPSTPLVSSVVATPITVTTSPRPGTLAPNPPAAPPPPPTDVAPIVAPVPDRPDPALQTLIEGLLADQAGDYSVAVKHLTSGQTAAVRPDVVRESASTFKLLVMVETFRQASAGTLRFDEPLTMTWQLSQTMETYGLPEPSVPLSQSIPLVEALDEMVTISENTKALMLLERVRAYRVNATLQSMGITQTQILNGTWMTAGDAAHLLERIATGRAVDEKSSRRMLTLLLAQKVRDRIPRDLPSGTLVANKTGNWTGVQNDVGIVYAPGGPFVIAVLSERLPDEAAGAAFIARLARAVYDYFE